MKSKLYLFVKMFLIFSLLLCSASCFKSDKIASISNNSSLQEASTPVQEFSLTNAELKSEITEYTEDLGGGTIKVQKYRAIYYNIPAPFADLVGRTSYWEWYDNFILTDTSDKMLMPYFIEHFNITREQFDKANLEWAKGIHNNFNIKPCIYPKDYANQMFGEVYNAEIIFTFDDDLINEYYLSPNYPYIYVVDYEKAVANGEYTPQTEVWVDIEQMEAEIIAKYGETEIVLEEPTDVLEEPTNALEEIATTPEESAVTTDDSELTQAIKVLTDQ